MTRKIVFCFLLLFAASSLFGTTGQAMPWDDGLNKIYHALGGNTAKTIGLILIIGAGIAMAFTEGQAIKKLFWIVIGLGIALNAASFSAMILGGSAGALLPDETKVPPLLFLNTVYFGIDRLFP